MHSNAYLTIHSDTKAIVIYYDAVSLTHALRDVAPIPTRPARRQCGTPRHDNTAAPRRATNIPHITCRARILPHRAALGGGG